jgi:hypothetical protein
MGVKLCVSHAWKSRVVIGPKREEVVGSWSRPHNEELCNLYTSTNIARVIISRE